MKNTFRYLLYSLLIGTGIYFAVAGIYFAVAGIYFPASLLNIEKAKISFSNDGVEIAQDVFEVKCKYDEIVKLDTINSLPEIYLRTNGIGLDTLLAGHFSMKGINDAMLFVNPERHPFVYIEAKGNKKVFINLDHSQKTIEFYKALKARLKF